MEPKTGFFISLRTQTHAHTDARARADKCKQCTRSIQVPKVLGLPRSRNDIRVEAERKKTQILCEEETIFDATNKCYVMPQPKWISKYYLESALVNNGVYGVDYFFSIILKWLSMLLLLLPFFFGSQSSLLSIGKCLSPLKVECIFKYPYNKNVAIYIKQLKEWLWNAVFILIYSE